MRRNWRKFGLEELLDCQQAVAVEDDDEDEPLFKTDYNFYDLRAYTLDEFACLCEDFGIHIQHKHNLEHAWLSWSAVKKLAAKLWPRGKKGRRNEKGDLFKDLFLQLAWNDAVYVDGEHIKSLPPHYYIRQRHEEEPMPK